MNPKTLVALLSVATVALLAGCPPTLGPGVSATTKPTASPASVGSGS